MGERLYHLSTAVMLFLLKKCGSYFSFPLTFMWKNEEKIRVNTQSLVAWENSGNSLLSAWKYHDDFLSGSSIPFCSRPVPAPAAHCPLRCGSPFQSSPAPVTGCSPLKEGSPCPGRLLRARAPLIPRKGRCASEEGCGTAMLGLRGTAWVPLPLSLHQRRVASSTSCGPEQALPPASTPVSSRGKWGA